MIQPGLFPTHPDHRDYDFHRTFGSPAVPTFPDEYSTDAGLWMPSQDAMALPMGCTGFGGADAAADEDGMIYDPGYLYRATPPGDDGGREIRAMLGTLCGMDLKQYLHDVVRGSKRAAYFNVRATGIIDSFDAVRLAMLSTRDEKRAVVAGIPWYPEFQATDQSGIMKMPEELSLSEAVWHCIKVAGWTTRQGVPYLLVKSWQGSDFGDRGWAYMSRELANILLTTSGAAAYTVTKIVPDKIQRVDLDVVSIIVSYIRLLISKLTTPMTPPQTPQKPTIAPQTPELDWSTPGAARHSARVIMDEYDLTWVQKDLLCACIMQESGFHPKAIGKPNQNGTQDFGLCQYNNGSLHGVPLWIGPGAAFASVDEVLNDPEKNVRIMVQTFKDGHLNWWSSYSTGAYKKYLNN